MSLGILVGDIGGTHCRLALAQCATGGVALTHVQRFHNAEHDGLASIIQAYLAHYSARPDAACLAVAGPTDGRQVRFTNLDWRIDTDALQAATGVPHIRLINDFTAVGWGLNALGRDALHVLQEGTLQPQGVKAAVGAGTGLGVSIGVWQQGLHQPLPTEGGHIGFAPLDAEQDLLLAFMRGRYGRVSVERLLSGPGIADLYRFCAHEAGLGNMAVPEPRTISQAALAGGDALATRALTLFASLYGQFAGDIALLTRAQGGIYLAGGIAPQILPLLEGPAFLTGFHAKGRFCAWMHEVPVSVILDPDIGLRGAAIAADHV